VHRSHWYPKAGFLNPSHKGLSWITRLLPWPTSLHLETGSLDPMSPHLMGQCCLDTPLTTLTDSQKSPPALSQALKNPALPQAYPGHFYHGHMQRLSH
jgi:hypothetical protein